MDVFQYVHESCNTSLIPKGCNASFITLILKNQNPISTKNFRPISLIRVQYKVIAKLLANCLGKVVDSFISGEQTAFIKGRQILDGPLMLDKTIS